MSKLPGVLFVIDVMEEINAVMEAKKLGIPVIALVDTNADPRLVSHPVPCNDDAVKTIELVTGYVVSAVESGIASRKSTAKA